MSDLVKAEPQDAAVTQLLTIKPETYVSEVFKPLKNELKAAIRAALKTPDYDIATTAGLTVAKQLRASFKSIRTTAENARKERKAPILQIGKLLDTKYAELEAEIREHEDKYDAEVKAEEARKERIKQEELARERARIEAIENRMANIRNIPARYAGASSATISKVIDEWSSLVLDPQDYEEFLESAINAVNTILVELERLRKIAVAGEEEQKRIAAERAELARMKAEKEEAERKAAAEAATRAEEERKRQAAIEEERAAQARRIAELEAQLATEKKASEPEQETPAAVAEIQVTASMPAVTYPPLTAERAALPVAAPSTVPTLTLGKINARLGFSLSADFLRSIGFEPADRQRSAVLYHEENWPAICDALISRIEHARAPQLQAA